MTERVDLRALRALACLVGAEPYTDEMGWQLYGVGVELWGARDEWLELPMTDRASSSETLRDAEVVLAGAPNDPLDGSVYVAALTKYLGEIAAELGSTPEGVESLLQVLECALDGASDVC